MQSPPTFALQQLIGTLLFLDASNQRVYCQSEKLRIPQHWSCTTKCVCLVSVTACSHPFVVRPHLSLKVVNGAALCIAVGAVVLVIYFMDGTIHVVFNLATVMT